MNNLIIHVFWSDKEWRCTNYIQFMVHEIICTCVPMGVRLTSSRPILCLHFPIINIKHKHCKSNFEQWIEKKRFLHTKTDQVEKMVSWWDSTNILFYFHSRLRHSHSALFVNLHHVVCNPYNSNNIISGITIVIGTGNH